MTTNHLSRARNRNCVELFEGSRTRARPARATRAQHICIVAAFLGATLVCTQPAHAYGFWFPCGGGRKAQSEGRTVDITSHLNVNTNGMRIDDIEDRYCVTKEKCIELGYCEPEGSALRTFTLYFAGAKRHESGYASASIGMKYRFIVCSGEIQVAYSLDQSSLKIGDSYFSDGEMLLASDAPVPSVPSVSFNARVMRGEFTPTFVKTIGDQFAGPALGFGCFSGQTKPVGSIKELVGPGANTSHVKEFLDQLTLDRLPNTLTDMADPLRNAALDARAERAKRLRRDWGSGETGEKVLPKRDWW